jgi:hypothetical protein
MHNKKLLMALISMAGLCGAHLAQAEQLLMPALDANGSTLALLLCGFVGLLKARRGVA